MTSKTTEQNSAETAAQSTRPSESLGAQLRRAREARGLSLNEIAEETRISRRYLEAIESDDYTKLPGGIFNRSFVKTYARKVGFDEKRALEDYSREMRERGGTEGEENSPGKQRQPVYTNEAGRPSRGKFLLSLVVAAIIAGGAYLFKQWNDKRSTMTPVSTANATANKNANVASNSNAVAANVNAPATSSVTTSANSLRIAVKTRGEDMWMRSYTDDGKGIEKILKANETAEFTPQRNFRVQFSKSKASTFDLSINGTPVKATPATKGQLFEFNINKDTVAELLKPSAAPAKP
ncbi:MAG: DUF4115 domain-containing protein [Pyrinomonadaceae bacterium]